MMTLEKVKELKRWLSAETIINNSCGAVHKVPWFGWRASLEPMIDSIESEASELVEESEAFAKRVQKAVESHEDVTLFGVDYMPLPVDADGVAIHVGDVVEYVDGTLPKEVYAIVSPTMVMVDAGPRFADSCRHHRAPTVEDLLRELVYKWGESTDPDAYISEYAAKLQLADDYTENIGEK